MTRWIAFAAVAVATASASIESASAAERFCGQERAISHGAVFKVRATETTCRKAKQIAGSWYFVVSNGDSGKYIYDRKGRRWRCRVTREATGTDPGYNPYTHVRCTRGERIIRFKVRS